jgi:D-sedoheptulose 7-phosphate isomerase
MKNNLNFFSNQFKQINYLLNSIDLKKIKQIVDFILKVKKNKSKVIIAGNGGSASTASHFSTDLSVNGKIKTISFNEYNLITALSNDFGYEKWIEKCIEIYGKKKDLLILVSCSGNSKNLVNANKQALKKGMKVITITACSKNNKLNSNPKNLRIWVNSKEYNIIEIVHHALLLTIIDNLMKK